MTMSSFDRCRNASALEGAPFTELRSLPAAVVSREKASSPFAASKSATARVSEEMA